MSPLVAAPNRGYADWQRVGNWDSGVFVAESNVAYGAGGAIYGPFDVSRFAYLGGWQSCGGPPIHVLLQWWADSAKTVFLGARSFVLSPLIPNNVQYRLPNLGPFVTLSTAGIGGGFQHWLTLIGTNRSHPLELIPENPVLISQQNIAVAAGATQIVYPGDYYAGPMWWFIDTGATAAQLYLEFLDTGGTWEIENINTTIAAGADTGGILLAPSGAWRFRLHNPGAGAGNYYLVVTPSLTGAT